MKIILKISHKIPSTNLFMMQDMNYILVEGERERERERDGRE